MRKIRLSQTKNSGIHNIIAFSTVALHNIVLVKVENNTSRENCSLTFKVLFCFSIGLFIFRLFLLDNLLK